MSARRGWRRGRSACGWLVVVGVMVFRAEALEVSVPVDAAALVRRAVELRLQEEKRSSAGAVCAAQAGWES